MLRRVLDAVAVSSEDYKLWIDGLQLVLHLGSVNTTKVSNGNYCVGVNN